MDNTEIWINNKNGNHYTVVCEAINSTNAQDGESMILYRRSDGNDATLYARERGEFFQKFTKLEG